MKLELSRVLLSQLSTGGGNTQTHAHLKVTCAQRGWLLFAGMARGIFLSLFQKKRKSNEKKIFFGMMVGRRQQLTHQVTIIYSQNEGNKGVGRLEKKFVETKL